jgi:hypothetical protein
MLESLKGFILQGIDTLNIRLTPFNRFERDAEIIDDISLSSKAEFYWEEIQTEFLFGDGKEFFWSMKPNDLGDMAMWQGFYTFTCAVKGEIPALTAALVGQKNLQVLGGFNRLCRGADSEINPSYIINPTRKYYKDRGIVYTQEVSESTLIGQLFGLWSIVYFSSEPILQSIASKLISDLAQQIIDDEFTLKDQEGNIAKFGDLRPSLLTAPIRITALACLLLLSYKVSGNIDHKNIYDNLVKKYLGSITHPETHLLWIHPQYQDILAYMLMSIMITSEDDANLKKSYKDTLRRQWDKNKEEGNSFYTYIVQLTCNDVESRYLLNAEKILQEFNTDPLKGPTGKTGSSPDNSHIPSKVWGWSWMKGGQRLALEPVPVWRRGPSDVIWQRSPYSLGGIDLNYYNGLDFLAAYYLGAHLKLIK